jgi:hypothetical protein
MNRLLGVGVILLVAVLAAGCGPMYTGALIGAGPVRPGAVPTRPYQPPPIGRWDAVMSLGTSSLISVLTTDGSTRTALFVGATVDSLILAGRDAKVAIPRLDVVRIDLMRAPGRAKSLVKNAAAGALTGAAVAGIGVALIPFSASGEVWLPPARVWGVGALVGAGYGIAGALTNPNEDGRPRTIYIARIDKP